jgi:hypothetical protein
MKKRKDKSNWNNEKLYVLPWGQMSLWGATVITNL